jgi:hypothetical protein
MINFCYELTNVTIPDSVTSLGLSSLQADYHLKKLKIPNTRTSIGKYAFNGCGSMLKYDFSKFLAVPALSTKDAFKDNSDRIKIIVPDNLYDQWISATNWSTYANYIYKASEVTE